MDHHERMKKRMEENKGLPLQVLQSKLDVALSPIFSNTKTNSPHPVDQHNADNEENMNVKKKRQDLQGL